MKKKSILIKLLLFYCILEIFVLSQFSQMQASMVRSKQGKKKVIRKPKKKRQSNRNRRVFRAVMVAGGKILAMPLSKDNTIVDKKNTILKMLVEGLRELKANKDTMNFAFQKLIRKLVNQESDKEGIIFNTTGDLIDKKTNVIILTKAEIDALDIMEEIKKQPISDVIKNVGDEIIAKTQGDLSKNVTGDIVDLENKVVVSSTEINKVIEEAGKTENAEISRDSINMLFKPATEKLPSVDQAIIEKKITEETTQANKKVEMQLEARKELLENKEVRVPITGLDLFRYNIAINNNNFIELLLKAMKFFRPFNDGIIDIFGILYEYFPDLFISKDDEYLYEGVVVLKKFIKDDDKKYSKIIENTDKYFKELRTITGLKEKDSIDNALSLINDNLSEKNKLSQVNDFIKKKSTISDIITSIASEVNSITFDEKMMQILFYIYAMHLYVLQNNNDKEFEKYINDFIILLIEALKIESTAKELFKFQSFNQLNYTALGIDNAKLLVIFDNEASSNVNHNEWILSHNTEFDLILLWNIIDAILLNKELIIKDEILHDNLKKIIYKKVEIKEDEIEKARRVLWEDIEKQYTENNISIMKNFVENSNSIILKNVLYQTKDMKIYIKNYVKELLKTENTFEESMKCFPLMRLINIYELITNLKELKPEDRKNINLYTAYFNVSEEKYKNQLFKKLFEVSIGVKKIEEEGKKIEERAFSLDLVKTYVDGFEKYKNYNNENDNIIELINIIANIINLDEYFIQCIDEVNNALQNEKKDDLKKKLTGMNLLYNKLQNTNKLFLAYLQEIFKVLQLRRKNIANFDKDAVKIVKEIIWKNVLVLGVTLATGGVMTFIGPENIVKGVGNAASWGVKTIFNATVDYPKVAGTIAGIGALALLARRIFNTSIDEHKGQTGQKVIALEAVNQLEGLK